MYSSLRTRLEQALVRRADARKAAMTDPIRTVRELASRPGAHIVVVVRDHLGGVMLAVPVLRALRQEYPQSSITLLTNQYALPAAAGCTYIDRAFGFYKFNADRSGTYIERTKDLISKIAIGVRLFQRVDLVVHLRQVGGRTLATLELLGAKAQIGFDQGPLSDILTVNLGKQRAGRSMRDLNLQLLEPMGLYKVAQDLEIWTSPDDESTVDRLLRDMQLGRELPFVCFHPGAHWGCNEWMPERWADLGDELYQRHGLRVVITGTGHDTELAKSIADKMVLKPIIVTGQTSLAEVATLYRRSEVVIGIDSLPRQLCQALKQRCVILFGAGNPAWFAPLADEPMVVLNKYKHIVNIDMTQPMCETWKGSCHNPICTIRPLRIIEVEDVMGAVEELLLPASGYARTRRQAYLSTAL